MKKLTDAYTDENGVNHTGHCWMNQNLAIKGGSEINSTYSNVAEGYSWNLPASINDPYQFMPSKNEDPSAIVDPQVARMHDGTHQDGVADSSYTGNNTGNYYNWYSATANYGLQFSGEGKNSIYSICPASWKLPSLYTDSGADGEYMYLYRDNGEDGTGGLKVFNFGGTGACAIAHINGILHGGCPGLWNNNDIWTSTDSTREGRAWSVVGNRRNGATGDFYMSGTSDYGRALGATIRCIVQ